MQITLKACEVINLLQRTVRDLKELEGVVKESAGAVLMSDIAPRPWWDLSSRLFGRSPRISSPAAMEVLVQVGVVHARLNSMLEMVRIVDSQDPVLVTHEDLYHVECAKTLLKNIHVVDASEIAGGN